MPFGNPCKALLIGSPLSLYSLFPCKGKSYPVMVNLPQHDNCLGICWFCSCSASVWGIYLVAGFVFLFWQRVQFRHFLCKRQCCLSAASEPHFRAEAEQQLDETWGALHEGHLAWHAAARSPVVDRDEFPVCKPQLWGKKKKERKKVLKWVVLPKCKSMYQS